MKLSTLTIYFFAMSFFGGLFVWLTGEIEAVFVGSVIGIFLVLLGSAIKPNNIK